MTAEPRWTESTDREAEIFFRTLTTAEIRHRQELASQQIARAWKNPDHLPEEIRTQALTDLNRMHDALTREMLRRSEPEKQ